MDRTPRPMEQYLHFKGGRYQVLNLAEMEDTRETLVIYQALYGEGKIYARRLDSFVGRVDRQKYPDAIQEWRFSRILPPEEPEELCRERQEPDTPGAEPETGEHGQIPAGTAMEECGGEESVQRDPDREDMQPNADLLSFLEAETVEERMNALVLAHSRLTDEMIDSMAFAMGLEIEPGPIERRCQELQECLMTMSRYELDRSRFRPQ